MRRRFGWRGALCAALIAAAPAAVQAQVVRRGLPPFAKGYEPHTVDERGMWMIADEDERKLRDSKFVINDSALNAYIRSVLCKTVGDDRCQGARIYVMRIAAFNASMSPNGTLQVWSGLLMRVRSEAELAAVLGHEFAHFEMRHSLAGYRHARSASDIMAWASLLGTSGIVLQAAAVGSFFSYGRAQEEEADQLSMQYLLNSPYNPQGFADVWERIMSETDATALGRKQRSTRYDRTAFFASHPTTLQRAGYLRELAGQRTGDDGEDRYLKAMAKWRPEFLADQLKLNDFGGTEYLLGQLAKSGWTPDLLMARADLHRTRGNPRDLVSAADLYRQVVAQSPDNAEAYRGLGMALLRGPNPAEGKDALRHYLSLRPDAQDSAMISVLTQ